MAALRRIADALAPELPLIALDRGILRIGDKAVRVSAMEETLLASLIAAQGKPVPRERLLCQLPGTAAMSDSRSINVVLSNIRSKVRRQLGLVNIISYDGGEGWSLGIPRPDPTMQPAGPDHAGETTMLRRIVAKIASSHRQELQRSERETARLLSGDLEVRQRSADGWVDVKAQALKDARVRRARLIGFLDELERLSGSALSGYSSEVSVNAGKQSNSREKRPQTGRVGTGVRRHKRHYI
jgi:hypothetical protein